jgi:dGTPase
MAAAPPPPYDLARLYFPLGQGRGRRYPELLSPYRNDFELDSGRILHSHAFRRLEGKTQVFAKGLSDHFRNRLTHTLEVTQIARTVSGALGLNREFAEALALVHDIGHPPFAHSGEAQLNSLMQPFGDRFDHNIHALRIVEWFEHRYARFPGLNLTFEVREGIVKHSRDYAPGEIPVVDEFLPGQRPPLEAQIIDLCDEIAYNTADLDDAYAAGLLPLEELRATVPRFSDISDIIANQFPGASDEIRMYETLRSMVDWMIGSLLEGTALGANQAGVKTSTDVRLCSTRIARFTPAAAETASQCKTFLREHVYRAEAVVAERQASMDRIAWLFGYYVSQPGSMPQNYEEEAAAQPRHRVVCDYIAGMTDGFFNRIYAQVYERRQ